MAQATDDLGAMSASEVINVIVSVPPRLLLSAPLNNAGYLEPADLDLRASATGFTDPIVRVEFFAGEQLVAVTTNEPIAAAWSKVPAGDYAIWARATDSSGMTVDSDVASVSVFPQALRSELPGRLAYWRFEDTAWIGEEGQLPVSFANILNSTHENGVALEVDSEAEAHLRYREVEADHRPNVDVQSGSLVFAFSPNWSSAGMGGDGPGGTGQFFSIGQWTPDAAMGCWNFSISADGSELMFVTQTNGFGMTNLVVPVSLSSNVWYQIALTYTPSSSIIHLDGSRVGTNGLGVSVYPDALTRAQYGLNIGSDHTGIGQIRGRIDDLETFNYPLTSAEISVRPDSDSDRLPDGWETTYGLDPQDAEGDDGFSGNPDGDALINIEEWLLGTDPIHPDIPAGGLRGIKIHTPLE